MPAAIRRCSGWSDATWKLVFGDTDATKYKRFFATDKVRDAEELGSRGRAHARRGHPAADLRGGVAQGIQSGREGGRVEDGREIAEVLAEVLASSPDDPWMNTTAISAGWSAATRKSMPRSTSGRRTAAAADRELPASQSATGSVRRPTTHSLRTAPRRPCNPRRGRLFRSEPKIVKTTSRPAVSIAPNSLVR